MTLDEFIFHAVKEDVGSGDFTSISCIPELATGRAKLLVKEEGILAGVEIAGAIARRISEEFSIHILIGDGARIKPGDIVFTLEGRSRSILKAERLILNCMQRMSGIATYTNHLTTLIKGTNTKLLDTRKTTPLLRFMEKKAVKIGGGENHRFGLYDMIMIKDNHIDFAGSIEKAIDAVHEYLDKHAMNLKIEIEARNLNEVEQILNHGKVNRIMLDNFPLNDLHVAVKKINHKFETEASGGINEKTIRSIAETGVDYISVGALTHQIKSLDLSLKAY